jgi:hypothetical protein
VTTSEGSLRPARWRGLPRRGTLLRVALVAALLGLAAAVLQDPADCRSGPPSRVAPGASTTPLPGARSAADGAPRDAGRGDGSAGAPGRPGEGTGRALPLPSGSVGLPVRLAEPAALAVLRPGSRVDLLVVPAASAEATLLASGALVLDVVGAEALDGSSALYLALPPDRAERAVGVPEGSRFAVVVRG